MGVQSLFGTILLLPTQNAGRDTRSQDTPTKDSGKNRSNHAAWFYFRVRRIFRRLRFRKNFC